MLCSNILGGKEESGIGLEHKGDLFASQERSHHRSPRLSLVLPHHLLLARTLTSYRLAGVLKLIRNLLPVTVLKGTSSSSLRTITSTHSTSMLTRLEPMTRMLLLLSLTLTCGSSMTGKTGTFFFNNYLHLELEEKRKQTLICRTAHTSPDSRLP